MFSINQTGGFFNNKVSEGSLNHVDLQIDTHDTLPKDIMMFENYRRTEDNRVTNMKHKCSCKCEKPQILDRFFQERDNIYCSKQLAFDFFDPDYEMFDLNERSDSYVNFMFKIFYLKQFRKKTQYVPCHIYFQSFE